MESQYSLLLLAMWGTTWVMVQWRVFIPSFVILGKMDSTNPSYRWWPFAWIIFAVGSFITCLLYTSPSPRD